MADGKESACNVGATGLIPGSGRSLGEGNGYPLQCSCLENCMDRGVWQATAHGAAKSWTLTLSLHFSAAYSHLLFLPRTQRPSKTYCFVAHLPGVGFLGWVAQCGVQTSHSFGRNSVIVVIRSFVGHLLESMISTIVHLHSSYLFCSGFFLIFFVCLF